MQLKPPSSPRRLRSSVALAAATVTALALVAPAGAQDATSPWSQQGGDAAQTQQGEVAGPDDPGFKWRTRLDQVETESAPDGYSTPGLDRDIERPLVGPDGTLIFRANRQGVSEGQGSLLGLDPADGSIVWEQTGMAPGRCGAVIDAQHRVWAGTAEKDEIAAYDPTTGDKVPGTRHVLESSSPAISTCGRIAMLLDDAGETLVFLPEGPNYSDWLQVLDVSGAEPTALWDEELDDLPFDEIISSAPRRGLVTDDTIILPARTGEDEEAVNELVSLSLVGGEETARVELPTFDGPASDLWDVELLRADDLLLVGGRVHPGGDGDGYVAAFDLTDGLAPVWTTRTEETDGPSQLTLGDGVVHANDGDSHVNAYRLSDGEAQWDEDLVVIERGGQRSYTAVSDVDGRLFTLTSPGGEAESTGPIAIAGVGTGGAIEWQFTREELAQAADLGPDEDLYPHGRSERLGPIDADGTLYLFNGPAIIAIDSSGGLGACELPFEDVDEERNVHAANICRLVEARITAGTSDTTYGPGQSVTRQQMAAFLTRTLDLPTREGSEFDDVDPDSPFAPYINALVDAEITAGVSDTEFAPGARLDRQQMATFLMRALELEPIPEHEFPGDSFEDVSSDNVHSGAIYAVADAEITQGVSENRFAPRRVVLRDQMASFLMRSVDYLDG
jgi:outer membrane protein assembly factor BamB